MLPKIYKSDADIRRHQINTLKIFNDNVVEICEGQEYQIKFQAGTHELCLHITLSPDFPNEKPVLKISPSIIHTWCNNSATTTTTTITDSEITAAPGLLNWTIHSDLGRVVQAVIREFERTPPQLYSNSSGSNITSPTIPIRDGEKSSPNYCTVNNYASPTTQTSMLSSNQLSYQTLTFPELHKLSIRELEFLNNNIDRQDEFLDELPVIKEQNRFLDDLIEQVEQIADENLAKQDEIVKFKQSIDEKIELVTKLAFENEQLHIKYQSLSDKYSPFNIKEELRQAALRAELECERIVDEFLKGDTDVDKFVSLYIKVKTLCQTRKTKEEKLSQQLVSLEKAGF